MFKSGVIGAHPYERPRLLKATLLTVVAVKWTLLTIMFIYGLVSTKELLTDSDHSYLSHYLVELFIVYLVLSISSLVALYSTLFEQPWLLVSFSAINLIVVAINYGLDLSLPVIVTFFLSLEVILALILFVVLRRRRYDNLQLIGMSDM